MRPLRRRVVRRLFRAFGLRRWSHWEEGWPGLGIEKPEDGRPGAVLWRGRRVARLVPAAALGAGDVTIVGSGPSMRGQDPAALRGLPVLLNGALSLGARLPGFAAAIEDEQFAWAQGAMVRDGLPRAGLLMLSPAALRALLSIDLGLIEGRDVVLIDSLLRPWRGRRRRPADLAGLPGVVARGGAALSLDPDRGVASCGTVAFSALQVALAARPRRVGLAGVDLSNARQPRFYEDRPGEPSHLLRRQGDILRHFALALEVAAERGVALECHSPASALLGLGYPFAALQATTTGVPTGTRS